MVATAMLPAVICLLLASCAAPSAPPDALPAPGAQLLLAPQAYAVDSTVLLNDAARRDKEVSYKLRADLRVLPVWSDRDRDQLLSKFELVSPQLLSRGKHQNADYMPLKSVWDEHPHSGFYAHWSGGLVQQLYLDPGEPLDVQNFKRSLVSLFQLQMLEGESNETDASGRCRVQYEALGAHKLRKVKRGCRAAGWAPEGEGEAEADAQGEVRSRRLARYELSAARDAIEEVYAEELHELGAAAAGAGLKARAWVRLTRGAAPAPLAPRATLQHALRELPAALRRAPPGAAPPADLHLQHTSAGLTDGAALGAAAAAAAARGAAPGAGGTLGAARAALALLDAAPDALAALLRDDADPDQLAGLCAALGLAGSAGAHRAAAAFLRLRQRDAPAHLAHVYFEALAHAPRAHDAVVDDALRLGEELAARDAALAESALLGAAAAAARASPAAQRKARDALAGALRRCADDECRRVRLVALGNLRCADAADLLLEHAARGGAAALAAIDALDALFEARGALPPAAPARLERVALALGDASVALETRAAALDLLLRVAAPAPFSLPPVLLQLRAEGAHELLRLAWQRLRALAPLHEPVRLMLRLLPPALRGWDAQALPGSSSLLVREAARGAGAGAGAGWRALLESRQVARGALLRQGRVRLLTLSPANRTDDTVTVELWTRGLEALAGAGEAAGEAEEAAGGLALGVGGARLRALALFRGQAELLGHVWAGSASEPTPALRALRPAPPARAALPLLGGAALRYRRAALLAAALDADAQVSLWARTARTHLALRTALAARGEAAVLTAWGELRARATSELEPRLRIDADLDFYDAVALCVRAHTAPHYHSYNVTLTSEMGEARRRVRRSRAQRWEWPGRTLALGAPNDATCRAMGAARD